MAPTMLAVIPSAARKNVLGQCKYRARYDELRAASGILLDSSTTKMEDSKPKPKSKVKIYTAAEELYGRYLRRWFARVRDLVDVLDRI